MILSKKAIQELIIEPEVSGEAYYKSKLRFPMWPGGQSGVTIGLGYDIGTQSAAAVRADLTPLIGSKVELLIPACGITGVMAKTLLPINVEISWEVAKILFYKTSLPKYARQALNTYPGLDLLHPNIQTAIVGLVYNRGTSLTDKKGSDRRREMRLLAGAISAGDADQIAALLRSMKRLWPDMKGLRDRRDKEADYVLKTEAISETDKLVI